MRSVEICGTKVLKRQELFYLLSIVCQDPEVYACIWQRREYWGRYIAIIRPPRSQWTLAPAVRRKLLFECASFSFLDLDCFAGEWRFRGVLDVLDLEL